MADPQAILARARQGAVPPQWRVFTKKRGRISGFLRGTSDDPDPLLVITPDGVVEYKDDRKPLVTVDFDDLLAATMKAVAHTSSDSSLATVEVWMELHHLDGGKEKWKSKSFSNDLRTIQCFIEAYSLHRAMQAAAGR